MNRIAVGAKNPVAGRSETRADVQDATTLAVVVVVIAAIRHTLSTHTVAELTQAGLEKAITARIRRYRR
jgi:hypothetical protein